MLFELLFFFLKTALVNQTKFLPKGCLLIPTDKQVRVLGSINNVKCSWRDPPGDLRPQNKLVNHPPANTGPSERHPSAPTLRWT